VNSADFVMESLLYVASPSNVEQIAAEVGNDRPDLRLRKMTLRESESADDAEARVMESKLIRDARANDPAVGYNLTPRWLGDDAAEL
jgi:hypothetical protein